MTAFLAVACGLLGLVIGSFLNVVIHRVPRRQSVATPRSRCPACSATLLARDNIPLLSFMVLRGKCRTCRQPIAWRYPTVELITAGLFVTMALHFGAVAVLPAYCLFAASLVAISAIDLEHYLVPKRIVYATVALGAPLLVMGSLPHGTWHRLQDAALGGVIGFGFFWCVHLASPKGMGYGDVRLAGMSGMFLGWLGLVQVAIGGFLAFLTGSLVGVALMASGRKGRKSRIPFAPFLAAGAVLAIVVGQPVRRAWLG